MPFKVPSQPFSLLFLLLEYDPIPGQLFSPLFLLLEGDPAAETRAVSCVEDAEPAEGKGLPVPLTGSLPRCESHSYPVVVVT